MPLTSVSPDGTTIVQPGWTNQTYSGNLEHGTGGLALQLVSATTTAGYTLVNGTGSVISWTTPNDGNMHAAVVVATLVVGSTETGGSTGITFTDPSNVLRTNFQILAGNQAAGPHAWGFTTFLVYPNTAFSVVQSSALTAGAAVLYAQIWGA